MPPFLDFVSLVTLMLKRVLFLHHLYNAPPPASHPPLLSQHGGTLYTLKYGIYNYEVLFGLGDVEHNVNGVM